MYRIGFFESILPMIAPSTRFLTLLLISKVVSGETLFKSRKIPFEYLPYSCATLTAFFGDVADIRISDLIATCLKVSKTSIFESSIFLIVLSDLPSFDVMKVMSSESINLTIFCETFPNPIKPIIMISLIIF